MSDPDPIPKYFSLSYMLRYALWFCWSNPVSLLLTLQAIFQAMTVPDSDGKLPVDLSHAQVHWIAITGLAVTVIIAQIRKRLPNGLPPTRDS